MLELPDSKVRQLACSSLIFVWKNIFCFEGRRFCAFFFFEVGMQMKLPSENNVHRFRLLPGNNSSFVFSPLELTGLFVAFGTDLPKIPKWTSTSTFIWRTSWTSFNTAHYYRDLLKCESWFWMKFNHILKHLDNIFVQTQVFPVQRPRAEWIYITSREMPASRVLPRRCRVFYKQRVFCKQNTLVQGVL